MARARFAVSWIALLSARIASQALWECHTYIGDQQATNFCQTAGTQAGYEYKYVDGGVGGPCPPCWCCKRRVEDSTSGWSAAEPQSYWLPSSTEAERDVIVKTTTATTTRVAYTEHRIAAVGVPHSILAGDGGAVNGDTLVMGHGDGLTLFSAFDGSPRWQSKDIAQLRLLGKRFSFTVDLSQVGCACNLAMYLVAMPALDWNGQPHAGSSRGGQPPFYCDANEVGGQWCPELDIMEANNHVFQAAAHKCDTPVNGHYNSCDRSGCDESTKELKGEYGPGDRYTIDTRQPFRVRSELFEGLGVFTGMRTTLQQGDRKVVMTHRNCQREYFAKMSGALAAGMSLRITYWGDKAKTMAWMDQPLCGKQACSGSNAGPGVISNITVSPLPVWTFSNPEDALHQKMVPQDVVDDPAQFIALGSRGIVEFNGAEHFIRLVSADDLAADDIVEVADADAIVKKFSGLPIDSSDPSLLPAGGMSMSAYVASLLLGVVATGLVWVRCRPLAEPRPAGAFRKRRTSFTSGRRLPPSGGGETLTSRPHGPGGGSRPLLARSNSSKQELVALAEGLVD